LASMTVPLASAAAGVMRSGAVSTLTSAGCAQAPGTGLAVRKPWTIEAATTFAKRAN